MTAEPDIVTAWTGRKDDIVEVFQQTFTDSEGAEEGGVVSRLARDVLEKSADEDIRFFGIEDAGHLVAASLFSRLSVPEPDRMIFMLSPMAVLPGHQARGLGSALLRAALGQLGDEGVTDAVTYGDPAYYARVGFHQIDDSTLMPPFPLSQPEGWLGQGLVGDQMQPVSGRPKCVAAFDTPGVW